MPGKLGMTPAGRVSLPIDELSVRTLPAGKTRLDLLVAADLPGSLTLTALAVVGREPGPLLLAVAGVHGNEYEGMEAIRQTYASLDPERVAGVFLGIPVANPLAYAARSRATPPEIDGLNLARVFPGAPDGTLTQRLAHHLLALVERNVGADDLFIDLHSGSHDVAFAPLIGFRDLPGTATAKAEEAARHFGLSRLWRIPDSPGPFNAETARRGIPTLGTETTGRAGCQSADVDAFAAGLSNLLRFLGIIDDGRPAPRYDGAARRTVDLTAPAGGFLRSPARLYDDVVRGACLGEIIDIGGDVVARIEAPIEGTVWAWRATPAVRPGELIGMVSPHPFPSPCAQGEVSTREGSPVQDRWFQGAASSDPRLPTPDSPTTDPTTQTVPAIYHEIGVRPIINGRGATTAVGGTLMHPEVLAAMVEAGGAFVELDALNERVGTRVAELTGMEAGYVTCGSAAGMAIAAAACIAGVDPTRIARLPDSEGMANEIVLHRAHRINYDQMLRVGGGRLVEVGTPERTLPHELEEAITERTAAVFYVDSRHTSPGALDFATVVAIAHPRGVPVIVDAASTVPPIDHLRRWGRWGADLVIFSGGKGLRGPQDSGLLAGRADLIEAARANGSPHAAVGRGMKVSKEAMAGLWKAIEIFLATDHEAEYRQHLAQAEALVAALAARPEAVCRIEADWEDWPAPVVRIRPADGADWEPERVQAALMAGEPSIHIDVFHSDLLISTHCLLPGEEQVIAREVAALLRQ
jgi:D-glucosaminate-6-phosphate ammonia-lyase